MIRDNRDASALKKWQKKYFEALMKDVNKNYSAIQKEHKKEYETVFRNYLLELEGPTTLNRTLTKKEIFSSIIFNGFTEIFKSFENLKDISVYIRRFPHSNTSITKNRYLGYHFENHLHEIYILRERLLAYLNTIEKTYKKDSKKYPHIKKETRSLKEIILTAFKGISTSRNKHVHEERFSDEDFKILATYELLSHADELYNQIYKRKFREIRKAKVETIDNNVQVIEHLLEIIYELIYPIIFTPKGNMKYPNNYQ